MNELTIKKPPKSLAIFAQVCLASIGLVFVAGCNGGNFPVEEKTESKEVYEVRVEKNLSYGDSSFEKFDLYTPVALNEKQRLPGIVMIHGGGWIGGDKDRPREYNIGKTLAAKGYVCISINYLLAEEGKPSWPQNLHNCKTAVQFLRKNAGEYHIDTEHIGVIGGSAGGHLSAMVGLTGPDAGLEPNEPYKGVSSRVQAVVALYGVHNMDTFSKSHNLNDNFRKLIGTSKSEDPARWQQVSSVNHISSDDPPFLIIHGTEDDLVPVEQSIELHKKLLENQNQSRLIIVDGAGHSFHLQPAQQDLRPIVIGFFDKHLK